MPHLVILGVALFAVIASTTPARAALDCLDSLALMRTLHADVRAGQPLTADQHALWRSWNQDCTEPMWQAALAPEHAPVHDRPAAPVVPATPSFGAMLGDALLRLSDNLADRYSHSVTCTTQRYGRRGHARIVTSCY